MRGSSPTARGMKDAQLLLPHLQGLSVLGDASLPRILRVKDFRDIMGAAWFGGGLDILGHAKKMHPNTHVSQL